MADPCDCPQCQVRRALFGEGPPTMDQRSSAIWSLAHVIGGQLAWFDDTALARILQQIADTRAERIVELVSRSQQRVDLSGMEVAGHG